MCLTGRSSTTPARTRVLGVGRQEIPGVPHPTHQQVGKCFGGLQTCGSNPLGRAWSPEGPQALLLSRHGHSGACWAERTPSPWGPGDGPPCGGPGHTPLLWAGGCRLGASPVRGPRLVVITGSCSWAFPPQLLLINEIKHLPRGALLFFDLGLALALSSRGVASGWIPPPAGRCHQDTCPCLLTLAGASLPLRTSPVNQGSGGRLGAKESPALGEGGRESLGGRLSPASERVVRRGLCFLQVNLKDPPEWVGPAGGGSSAIFCTAQPPPGHRLLPWGTLTHSCRPLLLWVFVFVPAPRPGPTCRRCHGGWQQRGGVPYLGGGHGGAGSWPL